MLSINLFSLVLERERRDEVYEKYDESRQQLFVVRKLSRAGSEMEMNENTKLVLFIIFNVNVNVYFFYKSIQLKVLESCSML